MTRRDDPDDYPLDTEPTDAHVAILDEVPHHPQFGTVYYVRFAFAETGERDFLCNARYFVTDRESAIAFVKRWNTQRLERLS